MSSSAPTVGEVLDRASARSEFFTNRSDGAAVQYCDETQRLILLSVIKTVEQFVGVTSQINTQGTDVLVALDANGNPIYTTTIEDGYAIRFSNGVPYIDTSAPFVSDPFGISAASIGGVPGIPLPPDLLRIISVVVTTLDSITTPLLTRNVTVVPQEVVNKAGPRPAGLQAFLSANRLIPIRTDVADDWSRVTSVRLGYVPCPTLTALSDLITLPTSCIHALTAHLAEWFAVQSSRCPQADKRWFQQQRQEADDALQATVNSLEGIVQSTIIYRRR